MGFWKLPATYYTEENATLQKLGLFLSLGENERGAPAHTSPLGRGNLNHCPP
jgi:hypothetical protein